MKTTLGFLSGAACGAVLTYIVDPRLGKRRRAIVRDAAVHLATTFDRAAKVSIRDAKNRVKGIFEESKKLAERESVDDQTLQDRVRTAVGRVSSHPNVEVIVEQGCVTLSGPVVDHEERLVLKAAKSVRGVRRVNNRMKSYKPLDFMSTQHPSFETSLDIMQTHWAPATRIAVGAVAGSMLVAGISAGARRGTLPGLAGLALFVRAATNREFKRLLGFKADPHDVPKVA